MLDFLKNGQGELLNFFFRNSDREYYLTEIGKNLNKEASYYQRYLDKFVSEKILLDRRQANLRFFRLNKTHPLYNEIKNIISKTLGLEYKFTKLIDNMPGLECAFIFGSIASDKENLDSDIDLMLIGSADQDYLTEEIDKLENQLHREINYHLYHKQEIFAKIKSKDGFISNILTHPVILLKGNLNEFTRSVTKRSVRSNRTVSRGRKG